LFRCLPVTIYKCFVFSEFHRAWPFTCIVKVTTFVEHNKNRISIWIWLKWTITMTLCKISNDLSLEAKHALWLHPAALFFVLSTRFKIPLKFYLNLITFFRFCVYQIVYVQSFVLFMTMVSTVFTVPTSLLPKNKITNKSMLYSAIFFTSTVPLQSAFCIRFLVFFYSSRFPTASQR
jgi:hypothetical protein